MKAELILSCDAKGNLKHHTPKTPVTERNKLSSLTSLKVKGLVLEESIIWVHDDLDPWAAMSVGFNADRQLVVRMAYDRSSDIYLSKQRYEKSIIIDKRGTEKLIDKLGTSLTGLTKDFADEFAYYEEDEESWNVSEVFEIFNEILNYLECLNIRYRIEKTYE